MRQPDDTFFIEAAGEFGPGIECIVMQMDGDRITKAKAAVSDERLTKYGFLIEGNDYVIVEWNWSEN